MTLFPCSPAIATAAMALFALSACGAPKDAAAPANNAATPPPEITAIPEDQDALAAHEGEAGAAPVAAWAGRWTGPEGLFLDIKPGVKPGAYTLTIKDTLDRQADYAGTARGESIAFTRDGKAETLRAGSGDQTGYKYLAGKQDCLIVTVGKEGYCRD